jgi:hypothetical protein
MRRLFFSLAAPAVVGVTGLLFSAAAAPAGKPVVAKGRATLKGKITLKGDVPKDLLDDMTKKLRELMAGHMNKACCLAGGPEEVTQQVYRIGDNKQVGNVFVWVQPPKGSYFPIDDEQLAAAKKAPIELGQPHCAFLPHCVITLPVYPDPKKPEDMLPTGQTFTAINDAEVTHNVKWGSAKNPGGNRSLSPGEKLPIELVPDRLPIIFQCNIHPWMEARVAAFDHPYAALSRSDTGPKPLRVKAADPTFGTYEIANVPAGVKLRLFAWHEGPGFLHTGGFAGEEVELKPGENTRDFELEIK